MTTDIAAGLLRWDPASMGPDGVEQEYEYDGGNSSSRLFERSRIKALAGKRGYHFDVDVVVENGKHKPKCQTVVTSYSPDSHTVTGSSSSESKQRGFSHSFSHACRSLSLLPHTYLEMIERESTYPHLIWYIMLS